MLDESSGSNSGSPSTDNESSSSTRSASPISNGSFSSEPSLSLPPTTTKAPCEGERECFCAMKCLICLESHPKFAIQKLSCNHQFCAHCLSFCPPGLCPYPLCCAQRNMMVLVDELEGTDSAITIDKHHRIVFGDRGPNLLKLEERQRQAKIREAKKSISITIPSNNFLILRA